MNPDRKIRDHPLLQGLPEEALQRLLCRAEVKSYAKEHVLFEEGSNAKCLFALLQGVVELYTPRPRRDAVILLMWPGDIFMPAATLTGEPYLLSGRALGRIEILQFDAKQIVEELGRNHEFSYRMLRVVADQFRRTVRHLKDLKVRTGPERVAAFMLRLVLQTGKGGYADLPLPKASIASRLGLTPESFSRALNELSDQGLTVRGTRIIVNDREKLKKFCHPDPLIDGIFIA